MKDPAILFYTSDFLSGTFTMSNEDVGKYIRLLCLQHQRGRLDEKTMKNICITYVEDVYSKFIKDESGLYYNKRLESEAIKRREYSESRRKNILSRYNNPKKTNPVKTKKKSTYVEHMGNANINVNRDIDINKDILVFWDYFLLKTQKKYILTDERKNLIKRRLATHSLDNLKKAVDNFVADDWEGRANHLDLIYCIGKQQGKPDNLDKWIDTKQNSKGADTLEKEWM